MTTRQFRIALILAGLSAMSTAQGSDDFNCRGLVGGAMAQCLQGLGPASSRPGSAVSRQEERAPAKSESARPAENGTGIGTSIGTSIGNSVGAIGTSVGSFLGGLFSGPTRSSKRGLNCQGLVGGAMSQCLQGMGPASAPVTGAEAANSASADAGVIGIDGILSNVSRNFSVGGGSLNCQGLSGAALGQCVQGGR